MRKFEEIVLHYTPPELCPYPEYRGKPYYSIKYEENGEHFVGFGTYNIEVLSSYLREYFIHERPQGEWILCNDTYFSKCSICGDIWLNEECKNFCTNCGADMRKEGSDEEDQ